MAAKGNTLVLSHRWAYTDTHTHTRKHLSPTLALQSIHSGWIVVVI